MVSEVIKGLACGLALYHLIDHLTCHESEVKNPRSFYKVCCTGCTTDITFILV